MTAAKRLRKPIGSGGRAWNEEHDAQTAILLGGRLTAEKRLAAARGEHPRIDVLDMLEWPGATLYDYSWVDERTADSFLVRWLLPMTRRLLGWSAALALMAFPAVQDADIVYATGEDVGLPLAVLLRVLRRERPRLIVRMEQPIYGRTRFRRWIFSRYLRFALRRVDRTLTRTPAHARRLVAEHGAAVNSAVFVPETTDTRFFSPSQSVDAVPDIPTEPYLVSAGLEMRDYETLIMAARDLPLRVVIAAGSPWSHLRFRAQDDALPANVEVASFPRPHMRELYRSATAVVVPVRQTERACGMNVVLEAWAMARPVIASRTKGLVDYIADGETGLLVDIGDVAALRTKILYLLQQPEEAERLAQSGHQHVTATLDLDRYLADVTRAMNELLAEPPGGTPGYRPVKEKHLASG